MSNLGNHLSTATAVLLTIFYSAAGTLAAPEHNEGQNADTQAPIQIRFTDGNLIRADKVSLTDQSKLLVDTSLFHKQAKFRLDQLLNINLPRAAHSPLQDRQTHVYLQPRFGESTGDVLSGTLKEITKDSISLETPYAGTINIGRAYVRKISHQRLGNGYYQGPNGEFEWAIKPKASWLYYPASLQSVEAGHIGRDVKLQDLSQISFNAQWQSSMRFKLQLFSSDITSSHPDAYYELNINRSYAYMRTRGVIKRNARELGGGRWKQLSIKPKENSARFDLFVNRKTGLINVYMNGQAACILQSENPNPENLGTGLSFLAEDRYPIVISHISVSPWDGVTLPETNTDTDGKKKKISVQTQLSTTDGKTHPCTTARVKNKQLHLTTADSKSVTIPVNQLHKIEFPTRSEEPKKYQHDIRAWFQHGGHVTLNLKSIKDGKVTGFSQALGDLSVDLSAFAYLEFNIYDRRLNKQR